LKEAPREPSVNVQVVRGTVSEEDDENTGIIGNIISLIKMTKKMSSFTK
jgi:hypothetical protein